ncbi:related to ribosomal protein YmS18, mitochondrial [Ustilago trichophora]|uniref:Related to ribosomal protein YmS18, mitochondrial n=1 Tax=Ustilago trichophora TaxID=86804 RepID=A0A5C3EPX8_9BASI|nr:related to ribosomal protein YmS18, mitochondrial [Ustilago trichophora]
MLRGIARQWTPALRVMVAAESSSTQASSSLARVSPLAFTRTFASSSSTRNTESDKSPSTQQLESQASAQPTTSPNSTGSSTVSDAQQRELSSSSASTETETETETETSATTSGRAPAPSNLDDILGSVSGAISPLPGTEASLEDANSTNGFRESRTSPMVRGASASRYSPALFHSSSTQPHRLFVNSSRNNTILTLTSPSGDPLASASGGSVGFKKSARSGYEAGYRAAFSMFGKINEFKDAWRISHLEVLWNGFGQGREAVYRALLAGEGQGTKNLISKMTDKTPVKIGGVRPKKRRML